MNEYLLTGSDGREWLLSAEELAYFELRFAEAELIEVDNTEPIKIDVIRL